MFSRQLLVIRGISRQLYRHNSLLFNSVHSNFSNKFCHFPKYSTNDTNKDKNSRLIRMKEGFLHYWHGFQLFYSELKITLNNLNKLTMGKTLTRKERNQLVRTSADLFRFGPFILFIIIPFMEFLLPFYVKYFPTMMPSPFRDKDIDKNRMKEKMKRKMELAKYLQDTLEEISKKKSYSNQDINFQTFTLFLKQVREQGLTANTEDILKFSSLFEDTITLESLHHHHLVALCKLLGINSHGPSSLLILELKMKVRFLKMDDNLIYKDNLDQYPSWELQELCRERGMRSIGVGEKRLRYQLKQWLELHLEKKVPITLLLLTRIMYLPDTLTPEEQLKQAILILPSRVKNEAQMTVTDDNKSRLQVIKDAQKEIKNERLQKKAASDKPSDTAPVIKSLTKETPDTAPKVYQVPIPSLFKDSSKQFAEKTSPQLSSEITTVDLNQIESAIVSLNESDEAIQQMELKTIKANSEEITRKLCVQPIVSKDQRETDVSMQRNSQSLSNKLDTILADIDSHMDMLYKEKTDLLMDIKSSETEINEIGGETEQKLLENIRIKKEELIDINDLMLALKKIQNVSDDVKMQHILYVLDDNKDGMLHSEQVLKVIKLLSEDNVKLNSWELSKVMEIFNKGENLQKIDRD